MIQYCRSLLLRYYLKNMNIEQYERQIFQLNCDLERISVLERKSRARLQMVHRRNQCFIRSINDKYKNLRTLLLGLIINIYQANDLERLNKLKNIIYSSELQHLTASRGLLKQQLHKNIGVNLELAHHADNFQNQLVKCFNCVAFFDEVLVSSFRQYFVPNQLDSYEIWEAIICKTFEISIKVLSGECMYEMAELNRNSEIVLERGSDCIFLPSNHKESFETQTIVDASIISMEEVQVERGHNLMTVSIDGSCESPYFENKENVNRQNNQNLLEKPNKISYFEPKVELSKSRKTNNTKSSSFWSFFCCSVD